MDVSCQLKSKCIIFSVVKFLLCQCQIYVEELNASRDTEYFEESFISCVSKVLLRRWNLVMYTGFIYIYMVPQPIRSLFCCSFWGLWIHWVKVHLGVAKQKFTFFPIQVNCNKFYSYPVWLLFDKHTGLLHAHESIYQIHLKRVKKGSFGIHSLLNREAESNRAGKKKAAMEEEREPRLLCLVGLAGWFCLFI